MIKKHIVKVIEISVIAVFLLVVLYFVLAAVLSAAGVLGSWPHPLK
ncbi:MULTISPECIES: hypothetical protein [Serratia]|nr:MULTISPECIES: hypothetical protein [Serratia]MDI9110332.1 hypothetical protein [Serratia marcescens]MDR8536429.1 hypothetical protein [Serratia nevei]